MAPATSGEQVGVEHLMTSDVSQHESAQTWLPIEYSQIDAGEFSGHIDQNEFGPVTTFLEYQNKAVHKRAQVPANRCTISLIDHGHNAARFMKHSMEQNDQLFLMPANTDFDLVIPGGVTSWYAVMNENELLDGIRTLSAEGWEHDIDDLKVYNSGSSRQLLEQFSSISLNKDRLALPGSGADGLPGQRLLHQLALIIHQASTAGTEADSGQYLRERRLEVVRKTRDYILSCLDQHTSPSVVDICKDIGVSARVLQYSFNEFMQITPVAYLRILRLNKVRQQLLTPAHAMLTVTDVATRFGFMHLSNFARDYAGLFGERPSATLQRGRR